MSPAVLFKLVDASAEGLWARGAEVLSEPGAACASAAALPAAAAAAAAADVAAPGGAEENLAGSCELPPRPVSLALQLPIIAASLAAVEVTSFSSMA
jgi:hypothetical protein